LSTRTLNKNPRSTSFSFITKIKIFPHNQKDYFQSKIFKLLIHQLFMKRDYYRGLFLIAGLYDFILGIIFLFFYRQIFFLTGMNLPENPAYLTFCAILIALFGILLFMIYFDLENSRKMIIYSVLIKFGYVGTVIYYFFVVGKDYVDAPFLIFAVFDFVFAILFLESLRFVKH